MSRIIELATWGDPAPINVIFVHGLGGHAYETWRRGTANDSFWPLWLAQDIPGISVFTVAYEAPPTNWLGTSMPLQDRAVNILEHLLGLPSLKTGPIFFVCHSLGGLIVKQIMLDMQRQAEGRPSAGAFLQRVKGIIFAATPHTGSRQGGLLRQLSFIAWPSTIAAILVANDPTLRSINVAYRAFAQSRKDSLWHKVFYETQDMLAGRIVDEASADPGLPGDPPVPIDADHITIVKPHDRHSLLYTQSRDFIAGDAAYVKGGKLKLFDLASVRSEQSRNWAPKALRLVTIALFGIVAWKGVQALVAPPPLASHAEFENLQKDMTSMREGWELEKLAREFKVTPKFMQQILKNIDTFDFDPQKAAEKKAGDAIVALRAKGSEPSVSTGQGADIDKAISNSRAKLTEADVNAATRILDQEVAEVKKAHGPKSPKLAPLLEEKAEIAKLSYDYPQAKKALYEAMDAVPDSASTAIKLGDIEVLTGHSDEALQAYQKAARATEKAGDEWGKSLAYEKIGLVQRKRSHLVEALSSLRTAMALAQKLSAANPDDITLQNDLAQRHAALGAALMTQGDFDDAEKNFRSQIDILKTLSTKAPGSRAFQDAMAEAYLALGESQINMDVVSAIVSFHNALSILDRLTEADPSVKNSQLDRAQQHRLIGHLQASDRDKTQAMKSLNESLQIETALAAADPRNADLQRDLSWLHEEIGKVQLRMGDPGAATRSFEAKLKIMRDLVALDPENTDFQRGLAWSHLLLAGSKSDAEQVLASYTSGIEILARLVGKDKSDAELQAELAGAHISFANAYRERSSSMKAKEELVEARKIFLELELQHPNDVQWGKKAEGLARAITKLEASGRTEKQEQKPKKTQRARYY